MRVPTWKQRLKSGEDARPPEKVAVVTPAEKSLTEDGWIRFVMNTGEPDRGGDIIDHGGTRIESFSANPVMPWGHVYRELPLGTWRNVHVDGKALIGEAGFESRHVGYELAQLTYDMYEAGILRAVSVGIDPIKWAWNEERGRWAIDFMEQDLLECSAVLIGQDQGALSLAAKAKEAGLDVSPLVKAAERLLEEEQGSGLWVPRATLEAMVRAEGAHRVFSVPGGAEIRRSIEPQETDPKEAEMKVKSCPSCGGDHEIELKERSKAGELGTHWGTCPEIGDPLFFELRQIQESTPAEEKAAAEDENDDDFDWEGPEAKRLAATIAKSVTHGVDDADTARTGALHFDDD